MPESAITLGEFVALLVIVMLPVAAPAVDGSNVAFTVADWPLDKITPEPPLALNPAPATATLEIVTVEVPELVSVKFCVLLLDTVTVPNDRLVELLFRTEVGASTVKVAAHLSLCRHCC